MSEKSHNALNKLCKWRSVLAGWHLGSRAVDEPGVPAMRDLQDFRLVARTELTAITALLLKKGIVTKSELNAAIAEEATHLDAMMADQFPGMRSTDTGIVMDERAGETMRRLRFPV